MQMNKTGFSPADILIPREADMTRWSVVACDQYTSEPEYWERVAREVGDAPSTLDMILPEDYLDEKEAGARIPRINAAMRRYLDEGLFRTLPESYVYLQRTLAPGKVRQGLVGKLDLEEYEYGAGSQSLVRPTEGTVESRLPPRIRVREDAPLESPHIMVLIDDPGRTVIEPLRARTGSLPRLYDFELMEGGGRICGWRVSGPEAARVDGAFGALAEKLGDYGARFPGKRPLLIAVGDGNHSLATAKACWERLKKALPAEQRETHPARYALVELVNVHDEALEFEPIHRILFGVDPDQGLRELQAYYDTGEDAVGGQSFEYVCGSRRGRLYVANPSSQLAAGTLQNFIDWYLGRFGGKVDYIHGEQVVGHLCKSPGTIGFLLPVMKKSQLFPTVLLDGALPRKTFSMGHAHEKRYYLECRAIR